MSEIKKNELSEEELGAVAGGTQQGSCRFVHAGDKSNWELRDGTWWAQCGGKCAIPWGAICSCHDSGCVNRWHKITPNGSPLNNDYRHSHWY